MITNKTEFWLMNNPARRLSLRFEAKKLRKMSPVDSITKALEIGCGEGQSTRNIIRFFDPKSIDAVDLDPKMIARAKKRLTDKRVEFMIADAAKLSFAKNDSYDAVFNFGVIHHIPNWRECLREIHRVLRPSGYFHLEDLSIESFTKPLVGKVLHRALDHPYKQMYTKGEFEKELHRLGFKVISGAHLSGAFWKVLQK